MCVCVCVSVNASLQYPPHCVYDRLRKIYIRKEYIIYTPPYYNIIFFILNRVHLHFSHGIKIPNGIAYILYTTLYSLHIPNEPIRIMIIIKSHQNMNLNNLLQQSHLYYYIIISIFFIHLFYIVV